MYIGEKLKKVVLISLGADLFGNNIKNTYLQNQFAKKRDLFWLMFS